ncbi:hypothetical protein BSKO_09931 [Bryopsis sp. KO-2023]|nr:hypothetical protein BSKO_09931 [Bryopsis sp. KO-2023]
MQSGNSGSSSSLKHSYLAKLTFLAGLGGFLFGYDTGVISGALPFMEDDILVEYKTDIKKLHEIKESIVSVALLGAVGGSSLGGYVSDKFGRKKVLEVGDAFFIFGAIVMAFSQNVPSIMIGRLLVGVGVGLASVTVPVYIAECSPASKRAMLVTANVLMITVGQFIAYVMNYFFTFVPGTWRWMLGVAALPSLIQVIGLSGLPESPNWLNSKGKKLEGDSAASLLGISEEYSKDKSLPSTDQKFRISDLMQPEVRYELSIGVGLQIYQQFCGINTVMYYTPTILQMAGFIDRRQALLASLLPVLINSLGSVIGMWLIDRVGRRNLLLPSAVAVSFSLFLLGYSFDSFGSISSNLPSEYEHADLCQATTCQECLKVGCVFCLHGDPTIGLCMDRAASISDNEICSGSGGSLVTEQCPTSNQASIFLFVVLYLAAFSPGLGPVPWAVNSEIYPLEIRGVGNGIAATANWMANFFVSQVFLSLVDLIGPSGFFWLCSMFAFFGALGVYFFLPETKGMTLDEVQKLFKKKAYKHNNGYSRTSTGA